MVIAKYDRAAAGLQQIGARIFAFQNSGKSSPAVHDRSTMQTKLFVPLTAVLYPSRPRTMTSALPEMAIGAALFARDISALESATRYWSRGAMLGYGESTFCALADAEFNRATNKRTNKPLIRDSLCSIEPSMGSVTSPIPSADNERNRFAYFGSCAARVLSFLHS